MNDISSFKEKRLLWLILTLLALLLMGFYIFAWDYSDYLLDDDFNGYSVGTLDGQGTPAWGCTNPAVCQVEDSVVFEGTNSLVFDNGGIGTYYYAQRSQATTTDGTEIFYIMTTDQANTFGTMNWIAEYNDYVTQIRMYGGKIEALVSGGNYVSLFEPVVNNIWYEVKVEWRSSDGKFQYTGPNATSTGWVTALQTWNYFKQTKLGYISFNVAGKEVYFDHFAKDPYEEEEAPEFRIWGTNPASSTEITTSTTNFTFNYEGFATSTEGYAGWNGIIVNFCEEITGICAKEKKYPKADLSGTSGQKTLSFENFDFDANGNWILIGSAYYGMFNQNWEWVEGYTGNVVSPDYFVVVNYEGLPTIFEVQEPETWYAGNTEYATPTAFFSSVSDLLSPIFSKIGEFGSRITGFFNQNEAFSRGANIGGTLPLFGLYMKDFEFLFGGFPLMNIFILAMIFLIGFFLFKLILKIVRG
jgi:hypothetical protein